MFAAEKNIVSCNWLFTIRLLSRRFNSWLLINLFKRCFFSNSEYIPILLLYNLLGDGGFCISIIPAIMYLFEVNNINTRKRYEMHSKLKNTRTTLLASFRCFFIFNFEHISHLFLVFLLLADVVDFEHIPNLFLVF